MNHIKPGSTPQKNFQQSISCSKARTNMVNLLDLTVAAAVAIRFNVMDHQDLAWDLINGRRQDYTTVQQIQFNPQVTTQQVSMLRVTQVEGYW